MANPLYIYRTPAKLAGQSDLKLIGANLHGAAGKFAGQVELVGEVDIVPTEKLDRALEHLKVDGGSFFEFRYLVGGLWSIGSKLTDLEALVRRQASQLIRVQNGVDFLVKKWEDSLLVKIKAVLTILRLADRKEGDEARKYIENNHFCIEETINAVEAYVDETLKLLPVCDYLRVEIFSYLLVVSRVRAKIALLLGDLNDASVKLNVFVSRVESEASQLLQKWTEGVDLRDIAQNGPDDLDALLLAMEQIDGVGRYERLCAAFYKIPRLPEQANLVSLDIRNNARTSVPSTHEERLMPLESGRLVRKGNKIKWNHDSDVNVRDSGYLVIRNQDFYSIRPEECFIIEIPTSRPAASEIGKHIRALADLVVEARKVGAEGGIAVDCPDMAQAFNLLHSLNNDEGEHEVMLLVSEQTPSGLSLT